jgi:alpha/beta superfamily hydrolase
VIHRAASTSQKITIAGPVGALEALLEEPTEGARAGIAVVCHPHPLHGGTMQNKVAHTLARTLCGLGLAALRFNFRGVGASAGSYGGGIGELQDTLAVLDRAAQLQPEATLWIAGFSFGGCVAMRASLERPVQRVIAVAPAIERCDVRGSPSCPWLVVQGLEDELVDSRAVRAWVAARSDAVRLIELPGVDHYFHGRLKELQGAVTEALGEASRALPAR